MNNFFGRKEPNTQLPVSFLVSLPGLGSIFKWLASLLALTQEDQENAGVYLGGEGRD